MIILKNSAIRIGQPGSPVDQGAPVPGSPGQYYENGQFAPDMDGLLSSVLGESASAGLISTELPFILDGKIDENLLKTWNPYEDYSKKGVMVSGQVSKFSLAVISSTDAMFPGMMKGLGLTSIATAEDTTNSRAIAGIQLVTAMTSGQHGRFKATLVVYPAFEQFVTVPLVRSIKGRTSGVSVATYALLKAYGHILFAKMAYEGEMKLIGEFLEVTGWSKTPDNNKIKGHYLTAKSRSSFMKQRNRNTSLAEIENFTPQDDFADTFAQFITHRRYMSIETPDKYEVMTRIMDRYNHVLQS